MKGNKAIYVYVGRSSFVQRDVDIFNSFFTLVEFNFRPVAKWKTPFQFFLQLWFLLKNISGCRLIIVQLAGYHSVLPCLFSRITGVKSIIIASGTDCHSFPSIDYGNYLKKLLAIATKMSFRLCSHIVPKHESLWFCNYDYSTGNYDHQGIQFFNPGLKKDHTVIENGYDPAVFFATPDLRKPNSFISVPGGMHFRFQQQLKGIDLLVDVAGSFPQCTFTVVGVDNPASLGTVPSNVVLIPSIPNKELPALYSSNTFYLQLSMAEGFPNALCEAMLCECIPIGSNVFSIPEIIGDTGFILKKRNSGDLKEIISAALSDSGKDRGKNARRRIEENYSLEIRKRKFSELFTRMKVI